MKLIPLQGKYGEGKFTRVSDEDYEFVSGLNLWVHHKGYVTTYYQGKHYPLHQLLVGKWCDHANRDKLDNQRENLRPCTHRGNNANVKARSKSGYKGVYPAKKTFRAQISLGGKNHTLGFFPLSRWASMAYSIAAKDVYGEFACLDFTADEIVGMS